jgi:DNA-binding LytR/AlgR family response regulator
MINAIIIEDEAPAMKIMAHTLSQFSPEVNIQAMLSTVKESIRYFLNGPAGDIIFCDVQLTDGLSFEIFKQTGVQTPVIFTTGYDQFTLLAFENNGIDYLLKPVEKADVEKALLKYKRLRNHFAQTNVNAPLEKLVTFINSKKKSRLLVKRGLENRVLLLEDVVLFFTENKVAYIVDRFSNKYVSDKTLTELEEELDENSFFRVNRQYIINVNYVKGFKPYEKVKLTIDFSIPEINHSIIISQETAPAFRKWMHDA